MPEELKIRTFNGIVQVFMSGAFNLTNTKEFILQALQKAHEEKVNKILLDARNITTYISTLARFEVGNFLAKQDTTGIRIAILASEKTAWPDRFLETVSRNRGVNAKVTTEYKEALKWLSD